ncbi:GLPGLI family protein [Ascidiimonas aurantiaca]|uniref:GLPGLI family protein n=1 Tax=Ascidiimonas aurantiaca TaxID=1685432 RepID=UPI0030ED868F
MKKIIIALLLFCASYKGISQNQITHGKVTYSVSLDRTYNELYEKIKDDPFKLNHFKEVANLARNFQLELNFSDKISSFHIQKGLHIESKNEMLGLVEMLISKGTYFTDLDRKIQILQTRQGNHVYNVKANIKKVKWHLTREKKKIGDFICYKATYQKKILDNFFLVTAWYTPSMPLAFGPKEYAGSLPGLIMELDDPVTHFICTSIELNPKEKITIPFPDEATITEDEYQQQGSTAYQKLKKNKP